MVEVTRNAVARVGVDLSKRVFQVHAVDRSGRVVLAKALSPDRFFAWCAQLPGGCLVAMEACGGAHHVARRLGLLGLDARLLAGQFVTPYRMAGKGGKNDANDAAAICEAAGRPHRASAPSVPRRWWPVLVTSSSSPAPGSSAPGLAWCPAKTPPAARPAWGASPNVATTTSERC